MSALVAAWADFHLLRPHWLWALAALPLAVAVWRLRLRRADAWRGVVDAHLLPNLLEAGGRARWLGLAVALLGYALGVLALAGPSWRQEELPLFRTHAPLVIALDLSPSVMAADLPPSRLLQARAKLAMLLRERKAGEVALLAYAGDSFTVAPLTDDAANVALFLDALDPSVMPVDGQRADRAIAAAVKLLQQAEFNHGDILLLTDGADGDARTQAAQARAGGYRVSVLGLGLPQGAPYRQADGRIAQARLDEAALRALAGAGGGAYARLASGDADLQSLGVLDPARGNEAGGGGDGDGLQWRDDGYWLLPLVMLLMLPAFRRRGALAVLALCLLPPLVPRAEAAEGTLWRRADQVAQQQLQAGTEAYRRGDFAAAQQRFEGIDSDEGWYNLGNALARQGRYDEAIAAYDKALAKHPQMADAVANRAAVDAARKRRSHDDNGGQGQGQQGSPNQQNQGSGQKQNQDQNIGQQPGQSSSGSGQPGQQQPQSAQSPKPGASPQGQGRDGEDKPQPGTDPRTQQQADAAQRERMRQAMAGQKQAQAQPDQAAAQPHETAAQREQRQALEAWMRRVPDDPGSLLRSKFRLEQERRQREGNP